MGSRDWRKYKKAIDYCNKALELDFTNPEAWYLKGRCNGLLFSGEFQNIYACEMDELFHIKSDVYKVHHHYDEMSVFAHYKVIH